ISRSAFDLHTVLYTLIEAAVRLCNAGHGNIAREQDGVYQRVATYGYSDAFTKHLMNLPVTPDRVQRRDVRCLKVKSCIFTMCGQIPNKYLSRDRSWGTIVRLSAFRCYAKGPRLASWP